MNDDGNGGGKTTLGATRSIGVQEGALTVQPSATTTITSAALSASDSAYTDPSQLTYVLIAQPSFGTIVKSGVGTVSTFTQQDIDSN